MRKILTLLGLVLMASTTNGQSNQLIDQPHLETISQVDTLLTPDMIYLSILIAESDTKNNQSVEELESTMAKKLMEIGIDLKEQLTLSDLSSNFRNHIFRKQDILKTKAYELLVFDAKTAGQVMYALEAIGISNVGIERTAYSRIELVRLELKSKAVEKAKKQAEALTQPLNQTVGKAIYITDMKKDLGNELQGRVAGIRIRGYSSPQQENVSLPIEFEKIKLESEVRVTFLIN